MDVATATAVIATATSAVGLFDAVADQIVRFIRRDPTYSSPDQEHKVEVKGDQGTLKVEQGGRTVQVIRREDLKSLPEEYYAHIRVMESSVRRYYDIWAQVYPHRDDGDAIANAKTSMQLRDLALKMKDDLAGILDFLESLGVQLDDHYLAYRDVIRRYD